MSKYRELLLGCGRDHEKILWLPGEDSRWRNLTTLDYNPDVGADIVCDLDVTPWTGVWAPRPGKITETFAVKLPDDYWDEVHAYEVLEHMGKQGDVESFFATFAEIWRILKPGGYLFATTPSRYSVWLWADPGHRRAILSESLVWLDRGAWLKNSKRPGNPMSDYRRFFAGDFEIQESSDNHMRHVFWARAIKPARKW